MTDPVELAKTLETMARGMLDAALTNDASLVPGLYETEARTRKAFFDLETAVVVNARRRKVVDHMHARAKKRAEELLCGKVDRAGG